MKKHRVFVVLVAGLIAQQCCAQLESLAPLQAGSAPQTFEQLWSGYDPRTESLETETLKAWEEEGVVLSIVRYRIGVFKGRKAKMAAVYGYPRGRDKLPGLVQIHGGGQYADYRAVLTNAKRGYATISIAWAGRISAPGYVVNKDGVQRFWDGKTDDPDYRLTTDWGALDAYHAPYRNPGNAFAKVSPASWTLDAVESPRNNPWFLVTLGARRALTFLEQQPQVDANKLGVYGHSMGGKLTVLCAAADSRVKAAAPSCGGLSNRATDNALYNATMGDDVSLKRIACPIMFLSPANDFHGRINDLQKAVREIGSTQWRVTCSPHHNHQDTPEYEVATQLWFDQTLKGTFTCPETPESSLQLKTHEGVPFFTVTPDVSRPIVSVDIYYAQQGQNEGERNDRENTMNRFWRHASARQNGDTWSAQLPLVNTDKPLWVYANVLYTLDQPITGAGYYYGVYTADQFNLSSPMHVVAPEELRAAGVQATVQPSLMIESFEGDWKKQWFTYKPEAWARKTHKVYDEQWKAPAQAHLALDVQSDQPNKLVVGIDQYATEIQLSGGDAWQSIVLSSQDFHPAVGHALVDFNDIKELRLGSQETLRPGRNDTAKPLTLGAKWKGTDPQFRNLRWMINLVPEEPATAANYWCTWYAQNYWQQRGGEITDFEAINNPNAREELTYDHLYNREEGWATTYLSRGRRDYFFLIDHGWQTKRKEERTVPGSQPFFSMQIDPRDFKEYASVDAQESLRLFNQEIKRHGWRGLGLWVRGTVSEEAARTFVQWSKHAGVEYWKIDGGGTRDFHSYRIKQAIYPELQLEYINGAPPLNPHWDDPNRKSYPSLFAEHGSKQKSMLSILQNSDVFRTYDVAPILVSTSTMQRVNDILKQTQGQSKYVAILNIQDDPQVAAGTGCLIASKRHPNYMERTYKGQDFHHQIRGKRMVQNRMNEIERFGRWQRIAPAFAAGVGSYVASDHDLIDSYPHTERDTWFKPCWGKIVYQGAPAIMARNMPLPKVEVQGEAPYVMASTYPNGPVCVATEGRVKPTDQWFEPRARVFIQVKEATQPIGIFGHYDELVIEFATPIGDVKHVWAQDLLAEGATDIKEKVAIQGHTLTIPGKLIDHLGTSSGDKNDISVPGLVLQLTI